MYSLDVWCSCKIEMCLLWTIFAADMLIAHVMWITNRKHIFVIYIIHARSIYLWFTACMLLHVWCKSHAGFAALLILTCNRILICFLHVWCKSQIVALVYTALHVCMYVCMYVCMCLSMKCVSICTHVCLYSQVLFTNM